jgi:PRC-barrel domain
VTMDGEEVGSIGDIVSSGGGLYAIVEHGGFFGIGGNRVAIPLERIGMRGEDVVLLGLTEKQLEAMPDFDYESDQAVTDQQAIQIGRYE